MINDSIAGARIVSWSFAIQPTTVVLGDVVLGDVILGDVVLCTVLVLSDGFLGDGVLYTVLFLGYSRQAHSLSCKYIFIYIYGAVHILRNTW